MAKRSIEETFKAIKPKGRKGIPSPPTIGVGVTSNNSDLSTSLSQAGQQIAQLQSAYQQLAALITANTQAIQGNTSAQSGHSALSTVGSAASSLLGGLGLISPLISGIASLFGGSSTPAALPIYTPPPPVAISALLNSATPNAVTPGIGTGSSGQPISPGIASLFGGSATPAPLPAYAPSLPLAIGATLNSAAPNPATAAAGTVSPGQPVSPAQSPAASSQAAPAPQITVNVNAMDSQSFMDHSDDIANAVREAMLNMHPINGVVASL